MEDTSNDCVAESRIHRDFDDGASDLISTRSGSAASLASIDEKGKGPARILNRTDVTLSRAMMSIMRGNTEGASLPVFTAISLPQPGACSPRDAAQMTLLVAGCMDHESATTVWHPVSSGVTLLPGIAVDFGRATPCHFCPAMLSVGTPVIRLKHVSTFQCSEQRIHLSVTHACTRCAMRRAPAMRHIPLLTVTNVYLQERLTLHLTYVVLRIRPLLEAIKLEADDGAIACDDCIRVMHHTDDFLMTLARRRDCSEIAAFIVCSEACRARLQENLVSATHESVMRPRARHATDRLDNNLTPLQSRQITPTLHDVDEVPAGQWVVLSDEEFRDLARKGPDGITTIGRGAVIHHCTGRGCFCRWTHRGLYRQHLLGLGSKKTEQKPVHSILIDIYKGLCGVYLYTDILGSNGQTQCLACGLPTVSVCTECMAVRTCANDICRSKSQQKHRDLCRPYRDAWTQLVID